MGFVCDLGMKGQRDEAFREEEKEIHSPSAEGPLSMLHLPSPVSPPAANSLATSSGRLGYCTRCGCSQPCLPHPDKHSRHRIYTEQSMWPGSPQCRMPRWSMGLMVGLGTRRAGLLTCHFQLDLLTEVPWGPRSELGLAQTPQAKTHCLPSRPKLLPGMWAMHKPGQPKKGGFQGGKDSSRVPERPGGGEVQAF